MAEALASAPAAEKEGVKYIGRDGQELTTENEVNLAEEGERFIRGTTQYDDPYVISKNRFPYVFGDKKDDSESVDITMQRAAIVQKWQKDNVAKMVAEAETIANAKAKNDEEIKRKDEEGKIAREELKLFFRENSIDISPIEFQQYFSAKADIKAKKKLLDENDTKTPEEKLTDAQKQLTQVEIEVLERRLNPKIIALNEKVKQTVEEKYNKLEEIKKTRQELMLQRPRHQDCIQQVEVEISTLESQLKEIEEQEAKVSPTNKKRIGNLFSRMRFRKTVTSEERKEKLKQAIISKKQEKIAYINDLSRKQPDITDYDIELLRAEAKHLGDIPEDQLPKLPTLRPVEFESEFLFQLRKRKITTFDYPALLYQAKVLFLDSHHRMTVDEAIRLLTGEKTATTRSLEGTIHTRTTDSESYKESVTTNATTEAVTKKRMEFQRPPSLDARVNQETQPAAPEAKPGAAAKSRRDYIKMLGKEAGLSGSNRKKGFEDNFEETNEEATYARSTVNSPNSSLKDFFDDLEANADTNKDGRSRRAQLAGRIVEAAVPAAAGIGIRMALEHIPVLGPLTGVAAGLLSGFAAGNWRARNLDMNDNQTFSGADELYMQQMVPQRTGILGFLSRNVLNPVQTFVMRRTYRPYERRKEIDAFIANLQGGATPENLEKYYKDGNDEQKAAYKKFVGNMFKQAALTGYSELGTPQQQQQQRILLQQAVMAMEAQGPDQINVINEIFAQVTTEVQTAMKETKKSLGLATGIDRALKSALMVTAAGFVYDKLKDGINLGTAATTGVPVPPPPVDVDAIFKATLEDPAGGPASNIGFNQYIAFAGERAGRLDSVKEMVGVLQGGGTYNWTDIQINTALLDQASARGLDLREMLAGVMMKDQYFPASWTMEDVFNSLARGDRGSWNSIVQGVQAIGTTTDVASVAWREALYRVLDGLGATGTTTIIPGTGVDLGDIAAVMAGFSAMALAIVDAVPGQRTYGVPLEKKQQTQERVVETGQRIKPKITESDPTRRVLETATPENPKNTPLVKPEERVINIPMPAPIETGQDELGDGRSKISGLLGKGADQLNSGLAVGDPYDIRDLQNGQSLQIIDQSINKIVTKNDDGTFAVTFAGENGDRINMLASNLEELMRMVGDYQGVLLPGDAAILNDQQFAGVNFGAGAPSTSTTPSVSDDRSGSGTPPPTVAQSALTDEVYDTLKSRFNKEAIDKESGKSVIELLEEKLNLSEVQDVKVLKNRYSGTIEYALLQKRDLVKDSNVSIKEFADKLADEYVDSYLDKQKRLDVEDSVEKPPSEDEIKELVLRLPAVTGIDNEKLPKIIQDDDTISNQRAKFDALPIEQQREILLDYLMRDRERQGEIREEDRYELELQAEQILSDYRFSRAKRNHEKIGKKFQVIGDGLNQYLGGLYSGAVIEIGTGGKERLNSLFDEIQQKPNRGGEGVQLLARALETESQNGSLTFRIPGIQGPQAQFDTEFYRAMASQILEVPSREDVRVLKEGGSDTDDSDTAEPVFALDLGEAEIQYADFLNNARINSEKETLTNREMIEAFIIEEKRALMELTDDKRGEITVESFDKRGEITVESLTKYINSLMESEKENQNRDKKAMTDKSRALAEVIYRNLQQTNNKS